MGQMIAPATGHERAPRLDTGEPRPVPAAPTHIPLVALAVLTVCLLAIGASKNFGAAIADVNEYRCYALAFWGGAHGIPATYAAHCTSFLGAIPARPFAILPHEYGPLALLVFSLPLLVPLAAYPWAFAALLIALVLALAVLLARVGAPGAGHAWLFYVLLGSMATAAARFDVIPAVCVVLALVALRANRQRTAYALLAVGILLKLYPALLLPIFVIETWRRRQTIPLWRGPLALIGVVGVVGALAAVIAPSGWLTPLTFAATRCIQAESLPATLGYLVAHLPGGSVTFAFSPATNSMCEVTAHASVFSALGTALGILGVAVTLWLYWRGRLSLVEAAIAMLCVAMLATKVFSPQFLLWASPLVAYEYGLARVRAFVAWAAICLATTLCYPLTSSESLFLAALHTDSYAALPIAAALRNGLLAALLVGLCWRRARTSVVPERPPDVDVEAEGL